MARIPEIPEQLGARGEEVFDKIKSGPRGRVKGPLALWLHSPELAERAQHLGAYLRFDSAFEPRLSELTILLVAAHYRCNYEWAVHAPIALNNGLSAEVIESIKQGESPQGLREDEAALYTYVSQLLTQPRIDAEAFEQFHRLFGHKGVVDIAAIAGYYTLGAFTLNSVELDPVGEIPFPDLA